MKLNRIGLDLAKQVFQVHGVDSHEQVKCRKQLKRQQMLDFFRQLEPCLVVMEACGSAHYWARELRVLGHEVRLIAPQFVKPYVKSGKNDANDAEAICEAGSRPSMRYVEVKSAEQQANQSVHRIRSRVVRSRHWSMKFVACWPSLAWLSLVQVSPRLASYCARRSIRKTTACLARCASC